MKIFRFFIIILFAIVSFPGYGQVWPSRPVKMIIPFPPGGTLDTVGRMLAQKLSEQTNQNFIVENRAGGNGFIGADIVAKSNPDGYTFLFSASTFISAPLAAKTVPFNVDRDFLPVALVARAPMSLAVNKNFPANDVKSLMAYLKANPGKVSFAVGSIGSAGHLATDLFRKSANLDILIVPYKGTAPAFQDLVGGQIDAFIDPVLGSMPYYKSGMLKLLGVTSNKRVLTIPEVPTIGETIPGYEFYSWFGVWLPSKTPLTIANQLNAELNKALSSDMRDKLLQMGLVVGGGTMLDFTKFQAIETVNAKKIIEDGSISLD
jgi:tripartite-type tricarboxylate transporter receptor subunit TctC